MALLLAAALAWTLTVQRTADMDPGPGTMGLGFAGFLGVWVTMMAAMMLPAVAPVATMYLRGVRRTAAAGASLRVAGLVAGYLAAWAAFGVAAYVA
ncbi:MAG: DUF2182 domain-containing protein, partial [Actinomycetota bacterium]